MDCTSPVCVRGDYFPCGKCINCRARSRQEWVFRLRMEYRSCDFGLFVTLTYDEDRLPPGGVSIRDVQLFLKRLRKHFKSKVLRYYISSEYGDNTHRPHYHGLLFFKDIERTPELYDIITASWSNGFVQFGEIEEGSIVYVTKYCLKGSDVPKGQNENFRMLSKMNGGVGVDYLNSQFEYHKLRLNEPTPVHLEGFSAPMPRYYRTKIIKTLDLDEETKQMISTMYMENLNRIRARKEKKMRDKFNRLFPGKSEHDYIMWKHGIEDRKEELLLKHTKKQNIL